MGEVEQRKSIECGWGCRLSLKKVQDLVARQDDSPKGEKRGVKPRLGQEGQVL